MIKIHQFQQTVNLVVGLITFYKITTFFTENLNTITSTIEATNKKRTGFILFYTHSILLTLTNLLSSFKIIGRVASFSQSIYNL